MGINFLWTLQQVGMNLLGFEGRKKEMFYLMMHSTHFIYGYMVQNMLLDCSDSERKPTVAPSHRQDSTYHSPLLNQLWSTVWNEK